MAFGESVNPSYRYLVIAFHGQGSVSGSEVYVIIPFYLKGY